jgi:hypothetical protein
MMMIYKELDSQQDKDRGFIIVVYYGNYLLGVYEQAGEV